jgi:hypothetical protein
MPPFRLLIISTTLILVALSLAGYDDLMLKGFSASSQDKAPSLEVLQLMGYFQKYFNLVLWLNIPIYAFFSFLFTHKTGYNYAENIVFQTYLLSGINLFAVVFLIIYAILPSTWIFGIYLLLCLFYYSFAYRIFFQKPWVNSFMATIVYYILSSIIYIILFALIGMAYTFLEM